VENVDGGLALAAGFARVKLSGFEVWTRYLVLGGGMSRLRLAGYLAGEELWPANEHDIATDALNEALRDSGIEFTVAHAAEIADTG
jgi:hypothetical protein